MHRTSSTTSLSRSHSVSSLNRDPVKPRGTDAGPDLSLMQDVRLKLSAVERREKKRRSLLELLCTTKSGTAGSYGLMAGSSLARSGGMVAGTDAIGAAPFLSLFFLATLSLDAHFTRRDGKLQKAGAEKGQAKLRELCAELETMTGPGVSLDTERLRELQGRAGEIMSEDPDLQQQMLQICDLLVNIDKQARSLAVGTPKVLIHKDHLKAWRDHMSHKLAHLQKSTTPHTKRSIKRMNRLKSLIQMYDVLGEDVLKTLYVNLSCTQAKQVRDVVLYGINGAVGGPMQVAGAADTLSKLTHQGALLPVEVAGTFSGIGMVLTMLSIFSNYLDAFKDAPRELKRASVAKALVHRQMSGLAHVLDPDGSSSFPQGRVPEASIQTLIQNRRGRYIELHRITNQAWIRRTKGFFGMGLGSLSLGAQASTVGCVAAGLAAGAAAVSWASAGIVAVSTAIGTAYLSTIVQGVLARKHRKDLMRADEAVARIYLKGVSAATLHGLMSGEHQGPSPLAGTTDKRLEQLQLSSKVRKLVMKQLPRLKADPGLLKQNVYLSSMHLAMNWLSAMQQRGDDPVSQALHELPAQLNIPAPQVEQIRNMIKAKTPVADVFAKTQQMFFSAFGLELKIHDDADDAALPQDDKSSAASMDDPAMRRFLASIPDTFWKALLARNPTLPPAPPPPKPAPIADQEQTALKLQAVFNRSRQADRRSQEEARAALMTHAWTLVWETIRTPTTAPSRKLRRSWRHPRDVLETWNRSSTDKMAARKDRIRYQLKLRAQEHLSQATGEEADQAVDDTLIDELLEAAHRQADSIHSASMLQTREQPSRYSAVGQLALLLR